MADTMQCPECGSGQVPCSCDERDAKLFDAPGAEGDAAARRFLARNGIDPDASFRGLADRMLSEGLISPETAAKWATAR